MRRLSGLVVLLSISAYAQEIGNEIPNQNNGQKSNAGDYSNPYSKDGNAVPPPPPPPSAAGLAAAHGSAGRGSIGLSAYFSGSEAAPISTVSGTNVSSPVSLGTFSIAFFVADLIRLNVDLGFGMSFSGNTPLGFQAGVGVDIVLRSPADSVRPFISVKASFARAISTSDNYGLNPAVGFGAEYYLSPNFCFSVKALVSMPILLSGQGAVFLVAFSPSVGATVYF